MILEDNEKLIFHKTTINPAKEVYETDVVVSKNHVHFTVNGWQTDGVVMDYISFDREEWLEISKLIENRFKELNQ